MSTLRIAPANPGLLVADVDIREATGLLAARGKPL
jgi:hypothetical protein